MLHYISDWNEFQFAFDGEISPGRRKKIFIKLYDIKNEKRFAEKISVRMKDTRNF